MKKLILVFGMLFFGQLAFAQAWSGAGDQKLQVGFTPWGYGNGIGLTYDHGVAQMVSLGLGADIYFSGYRDDNEENNLFLFGRVNLHLQDALNLPEALDIYPGLNVGYFGKGLGLGAHLGLRYFFTPNIGAFIEAGNNGSIGLAFNL